jgi:ABC-2 type transport system permease protein
MGNYLVFLEKEWREHLRTKKLLVMGSVFLFFAISSTLLARYMGEFLGMLLTGDEAFMLELFPEMAWWDSYAQFYGNMSQIGVIIIVLMFMGIVLREKRNGTADLVFCKGVSPASFVLAKFTVSACVSLACLLVSVLVTYGYTIMLFGEGGRVGHVLAAAGAFGVFILMTLAWVILASTLAKSTAMSAVLGFLGFIGIITVSAIPRLGRFFPGHLMNNGVPMTRGYFYSDFAAHLGIGLAVTAVLLVLAIRILKKQEL